jgi:hypothetical protein
MRIRTRTRRASCLSRKAETEHVVRTCEGEGGGVVCGLGVVHAAVAGGREDEQLERDEGEQKR